MTRSQLETIAKQEHASVYDETAATWITHDGRSAESPPSGIVIEKPYTERVPPDMNLVEDVDE